jgi:protein phosphatase
MRFSIDSRGHSEVGLVRKNNQDSACISGTMLAVADGMGGAAAGDLASAIATDRLAEFDGPVTEPSELTKRLDSAVEAANNDVAAHVIANPALDGMGTTMCAMLFDGEHFGLASIGDSRAYRMRDGQLTRLTHDHSWVQLLIDEGRLTPEEAAVHPNRSLVLKVVNGTPVHTPDLSLHDLRLGDRLLLCSDGLCGLVDDTHLARLLTEPDLDECVARLAGAALDAGGHDNITIVLADVVPQSDELDARPMRLYGAAATVRVPRVPPLPPAVLQNLNGGADIAAAQGAAALYEPSVDTAPDNNPTDDDAPAQKPDDTPGRGVQGAGPEPEPTPGRVRRHRIHPVWLITLLAILVGLVAAAVGIRVYTNNQFFVGPYQDRVAIYQGVPDTLFGHRLGQVYESGGPRIADLPAYYAAKVNNEEYRTNSVDEARSTVKELTNKAQLCITQRGQQSNPQSAPTGSATAGLPGTTPEPTPSATASGTDTEDCG